MAIPFGRKKDSFGRMEGNVLFDDALNTIYLLLYVVFFIVCVFFIYLFFLITIESELNC